MEQHSTLEVHEVEDSHPFDYHGAKKEAPFRPDSYPERIPLEIDRSGVYSPEVAQPVAQESTTQEPTRRICGLPNRIFYLVLAAALLVVIGAIAGGVAGGLSSKKNHNTGLDGSHEDPHEPDPDNNLPGDSTPPTHPNVNILKESRLASSNGTDYNGNTYRMVFFQDTHGAVIVRRWDSQSNSWATSNITDALGSSSTPLNPMKGTPLATSSIPYDYGSEVDLWFIVPDSSISAVQLLSPGDAHIDQWQYELLDGNDSQKTQPGSQLTATWQSCWGGNCTGYWLTAFQHPSGNIFVVNGSDPDTMTLMVESRAVATNSSLSLIPAYPGTFYLISESPGSTGDIYLNDYVESDGGWDIGSSNALLIENVQPPSQTMQFTYLYANSSGLMVIALLPNGTVVAVHVDIVSSSLSVSAIDFRGGPSVNFTAISADQDTMFYGINNDEILRYTPDETDIYGTFVYVDKVYP